MRRLRTLFAKPVPENRPWVLWTWNLGVTREAVERQMALLVSSSAAGIIVAPGREMVPALMSEEFVGLFGYVLGVAEEQGIGVRLACDLSLPWTMGFSQVLWQHPDYRAQRLVMEHSEHVAAGAKVERAVGDPEEVVVVVARLHAGRVKSLEDCKLLRVRQGVLSWVAPSGEWRVFVFRKHFERHPAAGFLPNVFSTDCAEAYVEEVVCPLRGRFSDYVPRTFQGLVVEMPAVVPRENSIPWDDDLVVKYRAKFKKELVEMLPVLFGDCEEEVAKYRSQVYRYFHEAGYERFCGTLERWLRAHRMTQWVLGAERSSFAGAGALTDAFVVPSGAFAAAGIQCQAGPEEDQAQVSVITSANELEWRRPTVVVVGRSLDRAAPSLQSLRSDVDMAVAAGAAHIIVDGFACNLDPRASGKAGYGPFWYSPDAGALKPLCESAGALRTCLEGLVNSPQVAVLSPAEALCAEYRPGADEPVRRASTALRRVVRTLRENNIEFDVVSEEFLLGCSIRPGGEFGTRSRLRKVRYRALVVPYARMVSKGLLGFVEKLLRRKVTVVFVDEMPQVETDSGKGLSDRCAKLQDAYKGLLHCVPVRELVNSLQGVEPILTALVNNQPCLDIQARRWSKGGLSLYLVRNHSTTQDYYVSLSLPVRRHVYLIQCERGEIHEHPEVKVSEGKVQFGLFFSPQQMHVIAVSSSALPVSKVSKERQRAFTITTIHNRSYRMVLKNQWVFLPISPNILPLAAWNMRVGLSRESGGFAHFYETTFFVNEIPQRCYLVMTGLQREPAEYVPLDRCVELTVNGTRLPLAPGATVPGCSSDPLCAVFSDMAVCDLRGRLIAGVNRVILRTSGLISNPIGVTYPPLLAGDFSVKKDSRGWVVDEPLQEIQHDSWTLHGFPHLSGVGEYRHVFEVPNKYNGLVLRFSSVSGSISVSLNDTEVGSAWWQPLELDVTDYCTLKRNELRLRVSNTIDNLLRFNGRPSGVLGEAYVDVY